MNNSAMYNYLIRNQNYRIKNQNFIIQQKIELPPERLQLLQ